MGRNYSVIRHCFQINVLFLGTNFIFAEYFFNEIVLCSFAVTVSFELMRKVACVSIECVLPVIAFPHTYTWCRVFTELKVFVYFCGGNITKYDVALRTIYRVVRRMIECISNRKQFQSLNSLKMYCFTLVLTALSLQSSI